eukprot:2770417-Rhodomonas_salina.3
MSHLIDLTAISRITTGFCIALRTRYAMSGNALHFSAEEHTAVQIRYLPTRLLLDARYRHSVLSRALYLHYSTPGTKMVLASTAVYTRCGMPDADFKHASSRIAIHYPDWLSFCFLATHYAKRNTDMREMCVRWQN